MSQSMRSSVRPAHYIFKRFCSHSPSNYLNCQFTSLLSNPAPSNLQALLQFHALIITTGNSSNPFIASKLISFYTLFKRPNSSSRVFDSVSCKDAFLWNSVIQSHFSNGNYEQAFDFFERMRLCDTLPSDFTIPMVVSACAELMSLGCGRYIHGLALKCGLFYVNSALGSSFVYMYSKCERMGDASHVFGEMTVRDVVAWTALVIGYVQNGESEKGFNCFCEMHRIGGDDERPNFRTIEGGIQSCGNMGALIEGMCLHGLVVKTGLGCSEVVQSSLLTMYSKCGECNDTHLAFCEVIDKDILSWTSIISVYARFGLMDDCISFFWEMQIDGILPDEIMISCMLAGFGNFMGVSEGKAFHGLIVRRNYVLDQKVCNALISMYCKFECLALAEKLFDREHKCNNESWNTMIFGYCKVGAKSKCIELFRDMQNLGLKPDLNCMISVITSCSHLGLIQLGRLLHCYLVKNSMDDDVSITSLLIDMYGRNDYLAVARSIFFRKQRDIVTWNTMLSLYIHNGCPIKAVALFDEMILENLKPNSATLVTVVSACSHLASLDKGERVHNYIKEEGIELNKSVATALIDMYAKCGKLENSRELFNSIKERDVITWNVMISGYGMHGDAKSAIEIFEEMERSKVKPNNLTFLPLLSACAHVGLVEEGKYLFDRMLHYSVTPNLKHYACMVDLLGRSGNLQEAEEMVLSMPVSPDGGVWGTLLSACKTHNDIETGVRIAKRAIESDPENDGYYVMLANMYNSSGRWEEAEMARDMMKERGVGKTAGWSAV
ncbi:pentatricopeptide repeat-containing protein [Tripterygium wilfordii]|uniref:Pentatricopeptide repeat-containing protein n=1 Tax=Tripterygium wilfordii TaxID=458696 RepID=A0A7J7DU17_TRIWF|nr:pentatricopeptide repeat-containing protein At4g39952, mitochondrial [Tripterygium wilfordii]KAF5749791.1 pentatricopeptide repeat-containing protein [Tripterygium wilfordii]